MKLSLYTTVKNGLYFDYHVLPMLKHHLPLADEIVVNDGYSNDGTYEAVRQLDPKIRVIQQEHKLGDNASALYRLVKNRAREECTGDWCITIDCDEFIPEWEFARLRAYLETATNPLISMKYLNFYGNYKVLHAHPERVKWPVYKDSIHRNQKDIEFYGDGSNVILRDDPQHKADRAGNFECHHFGFVRKAARLRQKWRIEDKIKSASPKKDRVPGAVYDLAPHDWMDPMLLEGLSLFEGPYVQAVREDPDEFVRDDFKLVEYLSSRPAPSPHA
jgi:glycosyltransferase involved in cell wall biosynthesis